jgi:hypothetical protein
LPTTSLEYQVGEGEARKVLAHVVAHVGPHPEQDALALVVASSFTMGFSEVTSDNRPVNGRHDLGERDGICGSGQYVPATHTPFGAHEANALQTEQDLLQVGLGEARAFGEVSNRGRC